MLIFLSLACALVVIVDYRISRKVGRTITLSAVALIIIYAFNMVLRVKFILLALLIVAILLGVSYFKKRKK